MREKESPSIGHTALYTWVYTRTLVILHVGENLPAPITSRGFAYGQIDLHPENTLLVVSYLLSQSFQRRSPRGQVVFFKFFLFLFIHLGVFGTG